MDREQALDNLVHAAARFKACILSLPPRLFLKRMNGWAPRDIVAHLIGWNRLTIEGSEQIVSGVVPSYMEDDANDFRNVNARSVQQFNSENRGQLLGKLSATLEELVSHVRSLSSSQWGDPGVPYQRWRISTANSVKALCDDYDRHRQRIETWATEIGRSGSSTPAAH